MFNDYGSQASQRMVVKVKNVIARSLPIFCMEEYCSLSTVYQFHVRSTRGRFCMLPKTYWKIHIKLSTPTFLSAAVFQVSSQNFIKLGGFLNLLSNYGNEKEMRFCKFLDAALLIFTSHR